ncbi:MAG: phytanoyl-CoA dioxygenase family protein [Methylobacter tundripaludum]|uniref:Phytanoyl-CoA dioxygenase PhyH n=1 Tax=Methylobacter tundripaludum TaxID=173365 RepID=A0A2S6GM85_9GAMM|nr:phytanoyl-CoA dioxygenase family protein [Methylobacter tundripaludum]MCK9637928.1 phytanoyl-CoA dioxygenase family protein [Methylobacter tundripaludum]PPK66290.1 phytanoyl-CoA dioxygenase PhyH [Methylobacter tundripaludum]
MQSILNTQYFNEYFTNGFIDTGVSLPDGLLEDMKNHYKNVAEVRNDYPQYFTKNEHQAYLEGKITGSLFSLLPGLANKMVTKLYSKSYNKAIHLEQTFIEKVCSHLLQQNCQRFFKTRFIVASYDIYLGNDHNHRSFIDIHSDIPNFHHFYETENDITVYIPLIDVNEDNGGRLAILPESKCKLKVPGNVLLRLFEDAFLNIPAYLDENGYIDSDKIDATAMKNFINGAPYKALMENYKISTNFVRDYYADKFIKNDWQAGQVVLFNNKTFHAAETWRNPDYNREIYMIRLLPIYDAKIQLKKTLHGSQFNKYLIDTQTGSIQLYQDSVDLSKIPQQEKLKLRA